jgi:phosphoserine phosphatase
MTTKRICFDVDGTLIDDVDGTLNIWKKIHLRMGISEEENDRRLAMFRRGEMTYAEWVDLDVGDWKDLGLTKDVMLSVVGEMALMPGTRDAVEELQRRGYRLAIISGSLDIGIESLFPGHPFDPVFINRIHFRSDGTISHWEATPFDMEHKSLALRDVAHRDGLSPAECAFVGDNFNDVDVARAAGFSVAFNSKSPELDAVAHQVIREKDMRRILPFFPPIR